MPYIVLNLQEALDVIHRTVPEAEVVIYRHHMILGGQLNRFLPKDCYLEETGTAETAVGIFVQTDHPGRVTVADQPDGQPRYTVDYRVRHLISQALRSLR
jgi:hypothetical protein